jgi:hypothetical protein
MVNGTSRNPKLKKWPAGVLGLLALIIVPAVHAGTTPETAAMSAAALILMEDQADHAKPRDQCYLYTQLVDALMERAARQVAAGDDVDAGKTVGRIDEVTAKVQRSAARDARKLKNAEKMLGESARKLNDLSRVANGGERDEMRATLHKLDAVHNKILSLVFQN